MQKPTQLKLDGHSYQMQYLGTSQAIEIATEVGATLLPSLGKVLPKGFKKDVSLMDQELDLGAGFESLALSVKPTRLMELTKILCSVVILEGVGGGLLEDARFEEHFRGSPGRALKVAAKSFEVNCGDFFGSVVSLFGLTKAGATTQAKAE